MRKGENQIFFAPRIHFASHWLTIQPSLFDFLEDEVGELDDNQRLFVRIAESVELGRISRTFGDFAADEIASSLFKDFVKKVASMVISIVVGWIFFFVL